IKSIPPAIKDHIMSTYDRIAQRNKDEGEQIGIQKGKIEEKIKVVLNCFDQGIVIDMITNITGLSTDEVVKILQYHGRTK
ncbi:MAG: hypothetical protein WBO36_09095, partial [Saprospiraceae bacterium]